MLTTPYRVFISHARCDRAVADMLSGYIRALDIECDVDFQFLEVGMKYRMEIVSRIQRANELLVILSKTFKESDWLTYEVGIADGAGIEKSVLLLNLADGEISDVEILRDSHVGHLDDYQKYLSELSDRAQRFGKNQGAASIAQLQAEIEQVFKRDREGRS